MDSLWNESLLAPIPDEIFPTYITSKVNNQTKRITLTGDKKYIYYALYIAELQCDVSQEFIDIGRFDCLRISDKEIKDGYKVTKSLNKKIENKEGVISLTLTFNQFNNINYLVSQFYEEELKLENTIEFYDYSYGVENNIRNMSI
jgi:hypothetical protein